MKADPDIHLNIYSNPLDLIVHKDGVQFARKVLSSMPEFLSEEIFPNTDSDEELEELMRNNVGVTDHPCGTAKMGSNDDIFSVVDCELKVKGIQRLRVIDNSIIPTIPSAHTQTAAFVIGEKGAKMILEEWR